MLSYSKILEMRFYIEMENRTENADLKLLLETPTFFRKLGRRNYCL